MFLFLLLKYKEKNMLYKSIKIACVLAERIAIKMFKDNLKRRRMELGISQDELATMVGYRSRSSISKLESGYVDVTQKKLILLAKVLDTTPEALLANQSAMISDECEVLQKRHIALIQAGGKSTRNLLNVPNQFVNVEGKPIIVYVLEAYEKHPFIDEINVACAYGWESVLESYAKEYQITKLKHIVTGGNTILDSIRIVFNKIKNGLSDDDVIIMQESTRPLVNGSLISKLISSYEAYGNSVIVKPMNDFVQFKAKENRAEYVDRNSLYGVESPEIYSAKTLKEVVKKTSRELKDDGSCLALLLYGLGEKIHFCENTSNNMKIVRQEDSYIFKILHSLYL